VKNDISAKNLEKEFVFEKLPVNIVFKLYFWGSLIIFLNNKVVLDKIVCAKRQYYDLNISEFRIYLEDGNYKICFELRNHDKKAFINFGLNKSWFNPTSEIL
jgi:hypothetical protein